MELKFTNRLGMVVCLFLLLTTTTFYHCNTPSKPPILTLEKEDRIVLLGNNLCSRMLNFGTFETEMHLRFPDHQLFIRNMCDGGNTPGFRPHSARFSPWAFPGAEKFQTAELNNFSNPQGHYETPDQWMTRLETDIVLAFFGYSESFAGLEGVDNFKAELTAFVQYTNTQYYNDETTPQLVLISPIAFQDLSDQYDLPDGKKENENLALYTQAMQEVAAANEVPFVDVFHPSKKWFMAGEQLTIDGSQLNQKGYEKLGQLLAEK
ncbi:MAG: SGNH/GDSL hydrolase family protein, partial [Bacteroidota bacterium]